MTEDRKLTPEQVGEFLDGLDELTNRTGVEIRQVSGEMALWPVAFRGHYLVSRFRDFYELLGFRDGER